MRTVLFPHHQKSDAKFLIFAGYEMPLHYGSILNEYHAVRKAAGLFDVSHMGAIKISGIDTILFLNLISTNTVVNKPFGKALYTILCNDQGGAIDDILLTPLSSQEALMVVNASNRHQVMQHLKKVAMRFQVELNFLYESHAILSLQGPLSSLYMKEIFPSSTKLQAKEMTLISPDTFLSRTGYTGEDGFEIIAPHEKIIQMWEELTVNEGIKLCGLGARDLLRMEMGYALYGHELSLSIKPIESVAAWAVKLDAHDFIGKNAQLLLKNSGQARHAVALMGLQPSIARELAPIFIDGIKKGFVTSGSYSPKCKAPIALALLDHFVSNDQIVQIEIRKQLYPFAISKLPFTPQSTH